jgi:redox-sensitive bicupin YhaK (pirin superfamily)
MIRIRKSKERGLADHGWLVSRHSFSFAMYHDPEQMGFSTLRVINEDRVKAGHGFDMHSHRDMEIVSLVLSGSLYHADSLGAKGSTAKAEVQVITAGTGVAHSEENISKDEEVHFFQIWFLPISRNLPPSYRQAKFDFKAWKGTFLALATREGSHGALKLNADAGLYGTALGKGESLTRELRGRRAWIQVVKGSVDLEGQSLEEGDGAAIEDLDQIHLKGLQDFQGLLFDLP